jgi:hypothetical protein
MMHKIFIYLFILFSLFIASCHLNSDNRDYYFPLEQLSKEAKVYEYEYRFRDTSFKSYWYYQTIQQHDSIYLVGTCYDANFNQLLLMREQKVKNGMRLSDMYFYGVNTEGYTVRSRANIEGGAVFPFTVKDSNSVFINIISYGDTKDSTIKTTLTRNRRFLRPISYSFKNTQYDALLFDMKEEQSVSDPKKGGIAHVFKIEEIYAKNIGLVYSKRHMSDSDFVECRLLDITDMAHLEERFKIKLNQSK